MIDIARAKIDRIYSKIMGGGSWEWLAATIIIVSKNVLFAAKRRSYNSNLSLGQPYDVI